MLERCDAHKFCDSLKTMLQGEYAFDHLELEGLADLQMVTPEDSCWDEDSLARIASGYSVMAPAFRWIGLYSQADAVTESLKAASAKQARMKKCMV